MSAPLIDGIVLAGGQSQRMQGPDKAWVDLAGMPLIERAVCALAPQVDRMFISTNRDPGPYLRLGVPVADGSSHAGAGPLAGVLAGLQASEAEWLAVAPCDTPFLPRGWVQRLHIQAVRAGSPVAIATYDGLRQPVCMLVHLTCRSDLQAALDQGIRKVGQWQRQLGAIEVAFDAEPTETFMNINTMEDLARAQAQAFAASRSGRTS